jgi:hypothetical protein
MKIYIGIISIFICFLIPLKVFSQGEIQKEVRVVKPYTPTLSEASKINFLPEISDTLRVNPDFGYKIYPKRYETQFKIVPIKPAKMVGLPLTKLYKSQLTLGVGNYLTPLAELTVNELRSKSTAFGLYLSHLSSTGKVKLENGKKVDSDYNDNLARIYGKKMFRRSIFEGDISGGYNSVLYYGYEPTIDTMLLRQNIKQKIYSAGTQVRYFSANPDSSHFSYDVGFAYDFTADNYKNSEHGFDLDTKFKGPFKDAFVGGDFRIQYYKISTFIDTSSLIIDVNPYLTKQSSDWRFLLGLNTAIETENIGVFPRAEFEFNIVRDVLIPYMGVGGYREVNTYRKILFENPFIKPGTLFMNTDYSLIGFAGIKGRYSSKMAFNLKASYSRIYNMYFYVNDNNDTLRNQFIPEYDNVSLMTFNGEVTWHKSEKLQFILKGNYYKYSLVFLEKPWLRPSFELAFNTAYNLKEKILVNGNLFFTGKRYAKGIGAEPIELKPYLDANISVEYRYTKILSFFVRINNLTASKYQIWNQYPVQRFQFIAGFSYAL